MNKKTCEILLDKEFFLRLKLNFIKNRTFQFSKLHFNPETKGGETINPSSIFAYFIIKLNNM
jgi:hypothetical protein